MTKQRFSFSVLGLMAVAIYLLVAPGDSFAQPITRPLAGTVEVKNEGQVLSKLSDIVAPGAAYFIKSKGSQRVIEVRGGSRQPRTIIEQLTLSGEREQKFIFTDAGGGFFFLRPLDTELFVTLHTVPSSQPLEPSHFVTQELLSTNPRTADAQKWRVVESGEPTCFFIVNKADDTRALQPFSRLDNAGLTTARRDGNSLQKWILKLTTEEGNPDVAAANNGLAADCFAEFSASFLMFTERAEKDISPIFPEWRSVGETIVPDGVRIHPKETYKILEGVVARDNVHVSPQDQPAGHFTHDFSFHVNPDPPFRYLLGKQNDVLQRDIEVEWESGLAQASDENPASVPSIRGGSFGFYTAGHERKKPIWNWPSVNDWVHVEGIWIVDRGHNNPEEGEPMVTEIHPPRFVAVKRNLPERFDIEPGPPGRFVFATRADIFANGDGNIIWNNKRLKDARGKEFAEPVKMSERVYTVTIKHDLPRPTPTAKLKFAFVKQKGDSYDGRPIVDVFENGSPDVRTPHLTMTVSWAGDRISDGAVFAKTLYIYWDDLPSHGVPASFEIKKVAVTLESIEIQDKSEGAGPSPGEYRLFADIGGTWFFLNEFVEVASNDIIRDGLGKVWDVNYSQRHRDGFGFPFPVPPGARSKFEINRTVFLYLPPRKSFRFSVGGWEQDYIGSLFGKVLNPFAPCQDAVRFAEDTFDAEEFDDTGLDDTLGDATTFFAFDSATSSSASETMRSKGPEDDNFRVKFRVTVSRP